MIVVGITGGLGSGKSTVTQMLAEHGALVFDADCFAREAVARGTAGCRAVRRAFGRRAVGSDGELDRQALAAIVFADHEELERLNRIVHPIVIRRLEAELRRLKRRRYRGVVAVEIPLLVEANVKRLVDVIVVVDARRAQQMQRVQRETGWSRAAITRRLAAQLPLAAKRRVADYVIDNRGTRSNTRRHVNALWKKLKAHLR